MPTTGQVGDPTELSVGELGDSPWSGPTVIRILVGGRLRELREARGISREDAGYHIRGSHSKISRMEVGRTSFKVRDVADLLTLYGVTGEAERASLLAMVDQANSPSWWHEYRDVIPEWLEPYLGLEQDAVLIRTHEVQFVPGLLQTEDYARAVIANGSEGGTSDQVERRVAVRMRRRRILDGPTPCKFWVVLDESALHRQVGSEKIMRAQLDHLAAMAALPHITVQVLPLAGGAPAGGVGPVTILRFAPPQLGDVVYLEHLASAQYLTKDGAAGPYQHLMNTLGVHAAPATDTPAILARIGDAP
ncbi:helix-turn-helix domain-containing protein [Nonomuraea purpurea]|uniref:Helix-turn-helix domain-containing protein n=1 Tax=Nonomuraea purpurea TaxID=1849276 RepID=A0ABV8GAG2_9ACTN